MHEGLLELMNQGWNVLLECKGRGREYEMTFEASASKVVTDDMTQDEVIRCFYPVYAVGNTIDDVCDQLKQAIASFEAQ